MDEETDIKVEYDDHPHDEDLLKVKEILGDREVIRMKFPGLSGVDVVIMPPSPTPSPPPEEADLLPKINCAPLDLILPIGEDALFELVVEDNTDISVSWCKNKAILLNSGRYKTWNTGNSYFMKIENVVEDDEALYEYSVWNKIGEKHGDVQLLVGDDSDNDDEEQVKTNHIAAKKNAEDSIVKPTFLSRLKQEYTIIEGNPLELIVETEGLPEVSWFYEGRKLKKPGNEFLSITSHDNVHKLVIEETVLDDEGFYECVALYDNFEISTSADVLVGNVPSSESFCVDFDMDLMDLNCENASLNKQTTSL